MVENNFRQPLVIMELRSPLNYMCITSAFTAVYMLNVAWDHRHGTAGNLDMVPLCLRRTIKRVSKQ